MLLQISSGRGPSECELAVGLFLVALKKELGDFEILASEAGRHNGTYKSVIIRTNKANKKDSIATDLVGTILWINKSPYRPNHGRKNWFIGVKAIDEPADSIYKTGIGGIVYQSFKSSGKGGQHINKTESAVRAIHTATGLSAISSEERSQHLNKKNALQRLRALLANVQSNTDLEMQHTLNHNHNLLVRGNPVRIYEGTVFKRIIKEDYKK